MALKVKTATGTPDTYGHSEICSNCWALNAFRIPKGTTVEEYMKDKNCRNCECGLRKGRGAYGLDDSHLRFKVDPTSPRIFYKRKDSMGKRWSLFLQTGDYESELDEEWE